MSSAPHLPASFSIAGVRRASELQPAPGGTISCGIQELDALTGGLPRGALTEICGPASSGRTTLLMSVLAEMTRHHEVCALVDAGDSFDPHSAVAAGVNLQRLLWVRCRTAATPKFCNSKRFPRNSRAVGNFAALEQALKVTDLLLQGGGFGLVAVDLADLAPQVARRVPLTSWFRFRRAVEPTSTVLLAVEQEPYAKTCASLVLRTAPAAPQVFSLCGRDEDSPSHARVLHGLRVQVQVMRARGEQNGTPGRKPVQPAGAGFSARAQWAG
jgi:recombination protein RecA